MLMIWFLWFDIVVRTSQWLVDKARINFLFFSANVIMEIWCENISLILKFCPSKKNLQSSFSNENQTRQIFFSHNEKIKIEILCTCWSSSSILLLVFNLRMKSERVHMHSGSNHPLTLRAISKKWMHAFRSSLIADFSICGEHSSSTLWFNERNQIGLIISFQDGMNLIGFHGKF